MAPPTSLQLIVKTHTLALFLLTPISATLPSIKADTLSALQQFSTDNEAQGIPVVTSEDQFELYWRKETTTGTGRNAITKEEYVPLDESKTIKQQGLLNWNPIYIRFRDESGTLLDVNVKEPSLDDDDDDQETQSQRQLADPKGKGKAV